MHRRQFLALSALLATAASLEGCSRPATRYAIPKQPCKNGQSLLLQNASVVDVVSGTLRKQTQILIDKGRIKRLGMSDEIIDADVSLDLKGAYLTPGLINAHCHMTLPSGISLSPAALFAYDRQLERNAEECIKNGVTYVRDMLAITGKMNSLKQKIEDHEIAGPGILRCSVLHVDKGYGRKMVWWGKDKFVRPANNPAQAVDAVKSSFDDGADFIKIFQQPKSLFMPARKLPIMDIKTIAAICNEADRQGKKVALHQTEHGGYIKGLEGGVHSFEHVVRDAALRDSDIRRIENLDAMLVPTLSASFGLANHMLGDENWDKGMMPWIAKLRRKIMNGLINKYLEPEFAKGTKRFVKKFADPASYEQSHILPWPDPRNFTSAVVCGAGNAARFYEAGIPFGCGNDGGIPFVFPGAMNLEMLILQKVGIHPADALQMATINNAKLFGLEHKIGSIEICKDADLIVFKENPLKSTLNLFNPQMVFKFGKLAFLAK